MNRKLQLTVYGTILGLVILLASCSNRTSEPTPAIAGNTVAAFLTDSPADGVVSFRIDMTGASLVSSNGSEFSFSSGLQQIEIRHLELAPTLALQTKTAPNGNYTGLRLTFANPQITRCDAQGNVTVLGPNTVPSVRLASISINLPINVILQGNGAAGLMIDFDLRQSIQTDSRGNYVITPVLTVSDVANSPNNVAVQNAEATVLSISSPGIANLQLLDTGQKISAMTDASTTFAAFTGQADSLQAGETVELDAQFQSDGTLYTDRMDVLSMSSEVTFRGVVIGVSQDTSGHSSLEIVAQE
jgi:uncharacterized protein DUF4382